MSADKDSLEERMRHVLVDAELKEIDQQVRKTNNPLGKSTERMVNAMQKGDKKTLFKMAINFAHWIKDSIIARRKIEGIKDFRPQPKGKQSRLLRTMKEAFQPQSLAKDDKPSQEYPHDGMTVPKTRKIERSPSKALVDATLDNSPDIQERQSKTDQVLEKVVAARETMDAQRPEAPVATQAKAFELSVIDEEDMEPEQSSDEAIEQELPKPKKKAAATRKKKASTTKTKAPEKSEKKTEKKAKSSTLITAKTKTDKDAKKPKKKAAKKVTKKANPKKVAETVANAEELELEAVKTAAAIEVPEIKAKTKKKPKSSAKKAPKKSVIPKDDTIEIEADVSEIKNEEAVATAPASTEHIERGQALIDSQKTSGSLIDVKEDIMRDENAYDE